MFGVSLLEEDSMLLSWLERELLNSEFEDEVSELESFDSVLSLRIGGLAKATISSSLTKDEFIANWRSRLFFGDIVLDTFLFASMRKEFFFFFPGLIVD